MRPTEWQSSTGFDDAHVSISSPEGPYPAFVDLEIGDCSLLSNDARDLAALLVRAADAADEATTGEVGK